MRLYELLTEETVRIMQLIGIEIKIDKHYLDRLNQRIGNNEDLVDPIIRKLEHVRREIKRIPVGQQFWAYDATSGIGLGLRKYTSLIDRMNVQLKTVIDSPPHDGSIPIIQLP